MKKLTTLVLAAGLLVSSFAGSASAGEFKPVFQLAEEFTYGDAGAYSPENFNATTRIRFGFDYVASEDLSATILFQYRNGSWGNNNGNDFTADHELSAMGTGSHFRMRLAYLDWTIPSTDVKVRMGRHAVVAPSYAFGSAILDGRGDGITITSALNDNINVGFTWVRIDSGVRGSDKYLDKFGNAKPFGTWGYADDSDAVMLNAEFAYDGFKVAPWLMYASTQKGAEAYLFTSDNNILSSRSPYFSDFAADSFVIGASAELNMFDPFVFAIDALYSNTKLHNANTLDDPFVEDSLDGFYIGAKASYKFDNGTASLGGWYATGNDWNEGNFNRNDNGFVLLDGGFSASTILFDGNMVGVDGFTNVMNGGTDSPFGTWGIIAEYANFSFIENLSHTARVLYVKGTSENETAVAGTYYRTSNSLLGNFTKDDSAIEIDFDTTYQIYKNLSATLQLGYAIFDQSDLDPLDATLKEQDDIFRSALTFVYKF